MTYEFYIKKPLQIVGLNMNKIIRKTPQLMNNLDRRVSHPLIRAYS